MKKIELSRVVGASSAQKSTALMSSTVRGWLEAREPRQFMEAYNPAVGARVMMLGQTCGEMALRDDVPTLAAVASVYDEATAVAWLMIQIDSVDVAQGARAFDDLQRKDSARLMLAKYADMNVGEFLLFFGRYKLGEFHEQTEHVGGLQKLMLALRLYRIQRDADIRRIEREEHNLAAAREREEWARKAISYEQYLIEKEKENDANQGRKNDNCP